MSTKTIAAGLAAIGLIASIPAGASAARLSHRADPDRDGLSTKAEKRLGTKPRKADTDRDRLNDGREVQLGSNPLKADTDGNGVKDGPQLRRGENPCGPATVGTVASVDTSALRVTITLADASTKTVTVDNATVLRGVTDRDGSGAPTIADLQVGDQVIVRTSAENPELATMIAIKGAGRGDHGEETKGSVSAVSSESITLTLADSTTQTFVVNSSTEVKAFDRNGDGSITIDDIAAGDKVEVEASSSDPTVATEIKLEGTKVWGTVSAVGSDSLTLTTATGASVTATVTSATRFRIPDADGSGAPGLSDIKVGQQLGMVTAQNSSGDTVALAVGSIGGRGDRGPRPKEDDRSDDDGGDAGQPAPQQDRRGSRAEQRDQQDQRGPRGERGPRGGFGGR